METTLYQQLFQEIQEHEKQIERLRKVQSLINTYPDLKEYKDRWGRKYYTSSMINEKVDQVEIRHACGCCADSPLLAYFYKEIDGIKIYADPYSICIGNQNEFGYGDVPNPNWKKILRRHRIPEEMDGKVQAYFDAHPPVNDCYDDE